MNTYNMTNVSIKENYKNRIKIYETRYNISNFTYITKI